MIKNEIEIKNRWTGNVLFEYEKENNTIKDTLEQAISEVVYLRDADLRGTDLVGASLYGANLRDADLRGADLRCAYLGGAYLGSANLEGANLEGAYLYLSDEEIGNIEEIIKKYENDTLKIKSTYINKNVIPTRWNCSWKYGLIIDEYETFELNKKEKEFDLENATENEKYLYEMINKMKEENNDK